MNATCSLTISHNFEKNFIMYALILLFCCFVLLFKVALKWQFTYFLLTKYLSMQIHKRVRHSKVVKKLLKSNEIYHVLLHVKNLYFCSGKKVLEYYLSLNKIREFHKKFCHKTLIIQNIINMDNSYSLAKKMLFSAKKSYFIIIFLFLFLKFHIFLVKIIDYKSGNI